MSLNQRPAVKRGKDVDMTSGSILRHIILFALPLLAGNVFQQLYNMVDTWVVGRFVSNEAHWNNLYPLVTLTQKTSPVFILLMYIPTLLVV